jgi:hypothetical protein
MDEEQIKQLIQSTISETLPTVLQGTLTDFGKELTTTLLQQVDQKNSRANASVLKDVKKIITDSSTSTEADPEPPPGETNQPAQTLTMKALQKEIADMKANSEAKDRELFISDRRAALMGAIAGSGATSAAQKLLYEALDRRYGDNLKKEDGRWFLDRGDQAVVLDDALKEFLGTDEGKHFLPPSGVSGGGTREAQASEAARVENMSSGAMYMELLAG